MLAEVNLPNINGLSLKCDFVLRLHCVNCDICKGSLLLQIHPYLLRCAAQTDMILDADQFAVSMQGTCVVRGDFDRVTVENLNAFDAGVLTDEHGRKH